MKLSVLTPAYNRAHTLPACFESLKRQTDKNFEWVIIDDGSGDSTEETVKGFLAEARDFEIVYQRKENGGKHTALNYGYGYVTGDLILILDSDDYLTDDAVQTILTDWEEFRGDSEINGIAYLRRYENGAVIGEKFPDDKFISSYIDCRVNGGKGKGDKAEVFRAEVLKENPFPEIDGEKFISEGVIWGKLGFLYKTVYINKAIYVCEYLEGGLSKSGRALRIRCPLGGMLSSKVLIDKRVCAKIRLKEILLYLTYAKFAKIKYRAAKKEIKGFGFSFFLCRLPAFFIYRRWRRKYQRKETGK